MNILVLGGGGQVASAVVACAPPQHLLFARTHAELDIGDETAVARVLAQTGARWLVNAAAYTSVDLAEDQPAQLCDRQAFGRIGLVHDDGQPSGNALRAGGCARNPN